MENRKSVLETKPSEILTRSLTNNQQIWIYFIAATVIQSTIYMFDFAAGIAVVHEHYQMGYAGWGTLSLFLMYLPSGVFYVILISRPDLWDERDGALSTAQWFGYRTAQFIAYPIWVMYRYAKQLFWAVEALMQNDEKEREEALHNANQPSQTELYLFLQPFLQAIPQAILQMYIMLSHYQQDKTISEMQALSVTSSLLLIANKIVNYLWFESQKLIGRKEPWTPKEQFIFNKTENVYNELPKNKDMMKFEEEADTSTPFLEPRGLPATTSEQVMYDTNSDEIENPCNKTVVESLYALPMPKRSAPRKPDSGPEPRSVIDLREDVQILEEKKAFQSMPNLDQGSIYESISEIQQNTVIESEPNLLQRNEENLNQNEQNNMTESEPNLLQRNKENLNENEPVSNPAPVSRLDSTNVDLPTRKKKIVGRENDDALAKTVAFIWWLFFTFSRLLAIAACANFQPFAAFGILVIHYILVEVHLLQQSGFQSIYKVFIQLCLGYVFTFCFIEIRYKVKNIIVFYTSFFTLMGLENTIMSVSWYAYSDLDGFWYKFVFVLIFASLAISFMPMGIYFAILKPKKVKIVL